FHLIWLSHNRIEPAYLGEPEPRQRLARGTAEHRHHVGAKLPRILGTETRHCKPVPGGDTDLAAEGCRQFADPLHQRLVAGHDQRGADSHAAFGDRRPAQLFADVAIEPDIFSEYQPAAAAEAPAVGEFARLHSLAHR